MKLSRFAMMLLAALTTTSVPALGGAVADAARRNHVQHVLDAGDSTKARHLVDDAAARQSDSARVLLSPEAHTVESAAPQRTWWIFKTTNYPKIVLAAPSKSFPVADSSQVGAITSVEAQLWATNVDDLLKKIHGGEFGADATALFAAIDSATPAHAGTAPLLTAGPDDTNLLILMKHNHCKSAAARGGASPLANGAASLDKTGTSAKFDYNPCAYVRTHCLRSPLHPSPHTHWPSHPHARDRESDGDREKQRQRERPRGGEGEERAKERDTESLLRLLRLLRLLLLLLQLLLCKCYCCYNCCRTGTVNTWTRPPSCCTKPSTHSTH
jgi:hypothetical protein